MPFSSPRVTAKNYVSYFVSPFHVWCREAGYPELDVVTFDDGEWELIQYHRSPVVPALTPWTTVLTKMRHVEISPWIIQKWAMNLDLERKHVWDELERNEKEAALEQQRTERHSEDIAERQFRSIRQNPALMERIARNGLREIGLMQMARHIPRHFYRK